MYILDTNCLIKDVIAAIGCNPGGLGKPLSEQQKIAIREGRKNSPKNTKPFNKEKFLESADFFFSDVHI